MDTRRRPEADEENSHHPGEALEPAEPGHARMVTRTRLPRGGTLSRLLKKGVGWRYERRGVRCKEARRRRGVLGGARRARRERRVVLGLIGTTDAMGSGSRDSRPPFAQRTPAAESPGHDARIPFSAAC